MGSGKAMELCQQKSECPVGKRGRWRGGGGEGEREGGRGGERERGREGEREIGRAHV